MGMPVEPNFDQPASGFRFRDSVPDPAAVNTAFDAGDSAAGTDISWDIDTLLRVRITVEQTVNTAIGDDALVTPFRLRFSHEGGAYTDVGAPAAGGVAVRLVAAAFTDHDDTTELLSAGGGTFVTGDGVDATQTTDEVTFTDEALTFTELEFAIEIVGGTVANDDTIDLRVYYSDADESPPATALHAYTDTPRVTVTGVVAPTGPPKGGLHLLGVGV